MYFYANDDPGVLQIWYFQQQSTYILIHILQWFDRIGSKFIHLFFFCRSVLFTKIQNVNSFFCLFFLHHRYSHHHYHHHHLCQKFRNFIFSITFNNINNNNNKHRIIKKKFPFDFFDIDIIVFQAFGTKYCLFSNKNVDKQQIWMRHFMLKIIFRSNFLFWRLNINHYFYNTKIRIDPKSCCCSLFSRFISFQPLNVERLFDFQISLYIDCTHLGKLTKLMMMMIINELTRQQNWQKCYCWIECFFFHCNTNNSILSFTFDLWNVHWKIGSK